MKQEFKPMTWLVKYFDMNAQKIVNHNVLKYRENQIKQLKKQYTSKAGFGEALRHEFMYSYWSKAEWELIIELTEDNHILLKPWCGCRDENIESATIDVTDDESFDWKGFSEEHINKQIYKNKAKVSVYDQLVFQWDEFVSYCWNYHHKYQRRNNND